MKICWDNLERLSVSKNGVFRIGMDTYIEMEACEWCGEAYLTRKRTHGLFCSNSCAKSGGNSILNKLCGPLNCNYKGGIYTTGLTAYDTYKDRLEVYEDVRERGNTNILEVKCVYCGQWYAPIYRSVTNRLNAANCLTHGESRLYCSENCKLACPTYGRQKYPKSFKHVTSREVSTYLRQMVMERDNWTCQICGKTIKEAQLHCHHMDPATQNPMFQNDMDSCITLCKDCHKTVHKQYGCRYIDLRCKKQII